MSEIAYCDDFSETCYDVSERVIAYVTISWVKQVKLFLASSHKQVEWIVMKIAVYYSKLVLQAFTLCVCAQNTK